jgi:hypothetical protein
MFSLMLLRASCLICVSWYCAKETKFQFFFSSIGLLVIDSWFSNLVLLELKLC